MILITLILLRGGAVFTSTPLVTVVNSSFTDCSAPTGSGGALTAAGLPGLSNLTIVDSRFTRCWCAQNGGAVSTNSDTLSLRGLEFFSCNAGAVGGAVHAEAFPRRNASRLDIHHCYFYRCEALTGGGVYLRAYNTTTIFLTQFAECRCLVFFFVLFVCLSACGHLGGRRLSLPLRWRTLLFTPSHSPSLFPSPPLTHLRGTNSGGGVFALGGPDTPALFLSFTTFTDCLGDSGSGGMYADTFDTIRLDRLEFLRDRTVIGGGGGTELRHVRDMTVTHTNFTDCYTGVRGGGLYVFDGMCLGSSVVGHLSIVFYLVYSMVLDL